MLNRRRRDEGPDVPWNGNPAQIIFDCLCAKMPSVSALLLTQAGGHDFIVSIATADFLHGVLSFHLWYLLVSNSKNRTVVVVPSFLILLAKSHVELVIVARPLPADRFTFLDLDTSKIPSVRISFSFVGANDL